MGCTCEGIAGEGLGRGTTRPRVLGRGPRAGKRVTSGHETIGGPMYKVWYWVLFVGAVTMTGCSVWIFFLPPGVQSRATARYLWFAVALGSGAAFIASVKIQRKWDPWDDEFLIRSAALGAGACVFSIATLFIGPAAIDELLPGPLGALPPVVFMLVAYLVLRPLLKRKLPAPGWWEGPGNGRPKDS